MISGYLELKPLSVNEAWQGRRYKTIAYKMFEEDALKLLRHKDKIEGEVEVYYTFGLKNYGITDVDNLIKPLQDILVKAGYIEDDRKVVKVTAMKKRADEDFIGFSITPYGSS